MVHQYAAADGVSELNVSGQARAVENSAIECEDGAYEPHVGMQFDSEDDAKMFYEEYARHLGFRIVTCQCSWSKPVGGGTVTREWVCPEVVKVKNNESCQASLKVEAKSREKWVVTKFVKQHNHLIFPNNVCMQRLGGHISSTRDIPEACKGSGLIPSGIMCVSMDNWIPKNASSINYTSRQFPRKLTLRNDAQNLLDYLKRMHAENPGFFYAIQLDDDHHLTNVFWADARSRTAYSHFGDAVNLDTMYRVNQHLVPFAPITGVNHHGQTILFGCALLLDDSESSFIWLFKTFLAAMNDCHPVSILTDQDRAIHTAVSLVFPGVRHCISKWHVLREGQERLARVGCTHPYFQTELYNCINMSETVEEFESSWRSIIDKYDVSQNDWLQSIYNARSKWVPVYFRDCFFAAVSPTSEVECSFFDGYVNQHTTLPTFFRQYERAMENWFQHEIEADFETFCTTPVLRTPSPMEKQAANLYTRKIFSKFQEELVETFVYTANRIDESGACSIYRVAKFEHNNKSYIVTLNISELRASCSCRMFEYSGIFCRHVLTVFTVTNVLTLPSHYILKRWTRNAKCVVSSEEHANEVPSQDSITFRFNSLMHEAMRYAEEGSVASETYNLALGILREGRKKVSISKRNVVKVMPLRPVYDDKRNTSLADDTTPLLWPRQDEVLPSFKLNDSSVRGHHLTDLNMPRVGPVSIHREGGPSENMEVLPYLKSMTWVMENNNTIPENRLAVINLKLQDYSKSASVESEVKFQLSKASLEPMLKSMSHITEQLSLPANRIAVVNLKLQDRETSSGESEVRFQVSKDTLGAMLRSMIYIHQQLSNACEAQFGSTFKRHRKIGS